MGQQAKLPAGKMLMQGVVSHAINLVEHQQLVADRILRYTAIAGRENVVAGTDCGLGGRVHADLAWATLRVLVEGARLVDVPLALIAYAACCHRVPAHAVACGYSAAGNVAYSLPSRSWIRPARRWRCTAMPTWFGRSLGHAT